MKRKYTCFVSMIVVLIAALVLPANARSSKSSSEQKILRFGYSTPSKRSMSFGWEWLGPEFEKRTNGRYKIEYYPGETLFKMGAAFDSIVSNVAQITHVSVGSYERRLPVSNILCLPTLDFPSTLKGRIAAGNAFMKMYHKIPEIQEEYKEVKVFGFHQLFPYVLASKNKEIYLPEHFKGLKVGGTGDRMLIVSNNGGADVNQVPPDAYMNMDKGVTDAALTSWSQVIIFRLVEVVKYIYDLGFGSGAFAMIMNLNTWNEMSPNDQQIFMELWSTAFEMATENNLKDIQRGVKAATDAGVKIRKPTKTEMAAWRKAAGPVMDLWITKCKKVGVKDPEVILGEWEKLLDAYEE